MIKVCVVCGVKFETKTSAKYCGDNCRASRRIEQSREYRLNPSVIESRRKYEQSPERKKKKREYGRKYEREYMNRPEVRKARLMRQRASQQRPEYKEARRKRRLRYKKIEATKAMMAINSALELI